jgi:TetR/AcrR family transcriptional regulator, regulator of cefoperazone and chloramphenicol sensitivity
LKHLFVATRTPDRTRSRLLAAAAGLFADQGFHGTTVREIAARAGVNLAASNYHFGSKRALYLAVLREHFARVEAHMRRRGAAPGQTELAHLDDAGLRAVFRARVQAMVDVVVGPPPDVYALLMQREMTDPSEAMPVIVKEFIRPMMDELTAIVARLAPGLPSAAVTRCAFSIVGQALFYRFAMPAVLRILGERRYTPALTAAVCEHITGFSLGGLAAAATPAARRRRAS